MQPQQETVDTAEEAELRLCIICHFEGILKTIITEENDVAVWTKEVARQEDKAYFLQTYSIIRDIFGLLTLLHRHYDSRPSLDPLFNAISRVQEQAALLATEGARPAAADVPRDEQ